MIKINFILLILVVSSFPSSFCQKSFLDNYDFDGKEEFESEPWPDMLPLAKQQELKAKEVYYERDTQSIISNLLEDSDEENQIEELKDVTESEESAGESKILKVAKIKCGQSQIKNRISKASKSIENSINFLKKAQKYKKETIKCQKLLKWMQKWLNDVNTMLNARDFKKAPNKLKAVTNNIGYAKKLATQPASDYILSAIPEVKIVKSITDSLYRCVPQTPLKVTNLFSSPPVKIPNPTPYTRMEPVLNPSGVQIDGTDIKLVVDNKIDKVRIKSLHSFNSGIFTVSYKCPKNFEGIITGFHLASNNEFATGDGILYEVLGNRPDRVRVGFMVNSSLVKSPAIDLGLDCSDDFHQYTIIWEANSIKWLFDGEILRQMDRNDPNTRFAWLTATEMNLYAGIRRYCCMGVGNYNPANAPFVASFKDFKITSPISPKTMPTIPFWPRSSYPLTKFGIDYARESVGRVPANNETVFVFYPKLNLTGGRIVSPKRYDFGEFSAQIRCPTGNASGLVTSFYLSSVEGGSKFRIQDEIDFEFLGKNHRAVQLTHFVNGKSSYAVTVPLGFDCSEDFHEYTIHWTSTKIEWLVDNELKNATLNDGVKPFPTKPSYLYASLWNADNWWAGKYFGSDDPFIARYRNIKMMSPLS